VSSRFRFRNLIAGRAINPGAKADGRTPRDGDEVLEKSARVRALTDRARLSRPVMN